MSETLTFSQTYFYDTLKDGITVIVLLSHGGEIVEVRAKIDTGASFCVFRREHGVNLGLDIESGHPQRFGTATGSFLAYGHEITLSVLGIATVSTVYFAAEEAFTRDVLGQIGWLNRVRLGLVDYEGKLYLSANDGEDTL